MSQEIVVALLYNNPTVDEPVPEQASVEEETHEFTPFFDMEETPAEEEYKNIEAALIEAGYKVISFNVKESFDRLYRFLTRRKFDVIFNLVEYFNGRAENEMNIASLYELMKLPYTGANPLALSNCQNKPFAKDLLRANNLPTAKSFTVKVMTDFPKRHTLKYPVIVKPAYEDGSGGIENASIVSDLKSLKARVEFVIDDFKMPALVEEFIEGRELNVAVIGNGKRKRVLPISEINFDDMPDTLYKIVSYQAKWDPQHAAYHTTIPDCPADLPEKTTALAKDIAMKATEVMGTRDYARVDMRLNAKGELYILEVNPNPNLSEGTGIARSAGAARMKFSKLLQHITESALARKSTEE